MAELETAQRHLGDALRRLEEALTRRLSASGGGQAVRQMAAERDSLARDLDALRAEHDRLSTALGDRERENQSIRAAGEEVARRLDGSIGTLDRMLGS